MNVAQRVKRAATGTRVVVRCLGRFRLDDASGNQLQIRTKKARAVLAALALTGRPMSRDALADLLWSDRGPVQARSSLRQAIFELQHFASGELPILVVGRDDLAVRHEHLVTDLGLIRKAASEGDWPRQLALLESSEPGLLTDLDGLDQEFDDWLRMERGQEPARTLAMTVDAAARCMAEAGPRAALDLISEILRLDPVNEEATRLALRINHELGDSRALHFHYNSLSERLHDLYDAEPSAETSELFRRLSDATAAGRQTPSVEPIREAPGTGPGRHASRGWQRALASLLALVAAIGLLAALVLRGGPEAPAANIPIVIAVLPFEQQPRGDDFLASGLWEHTRAALSRNSALRVLGRSTTAAMAEQNLAPEQYLKRLGVTHVLEGTVRQSGHQVLVSVSLTRTNDGVAIWQDRFRGRMGEPFGLQDAIANGIEGKLRGRLAPDGGRRAEQIATMPEVYGLYSEARELIASRERANFGRAEALLREAVKTDPNYAPAWSLLGAAIFFNGRIAIVDSRARAEAMAAVRRALTLAPNLAQAHATLAIVEGDSSPTAERALRRAVALDPSYAEAWNWLGNALNSQYRHREAIAAYERAVAIDPLLDPAVKNLASTASQIQDHGTVDRLLRQITKAGASPVLIGSLRADELYLRGDYSGSIKVLANLGLDARSHPPRALWGNWFETLTGLGYYDTLHKVTECPEWYAPLLRGKVLPPKTFDGRPVSPEEFWTSFFFSNPASRSMINLGRSEELVRLYRAGFRNSDDFITRTRRQDMLTGLAPSLAVALISVGSREEASYLLAAAANQVEPALRRTGSRSARSQLAFIRAAQGERAQALALLEASVRQGWRPDGRNQPLDLADEPAFRELRGDPRFETMRKHILDHIARERAELGPLKV